jgi:hypothetical protein
MHVGMRMRDFQPNRQIFRTFVLYGVVFSSGLGLIMPITLPDSEYADMAHVYRVCNENMYAAAEF